MKFHPVTIVPSRNGTVLNTVKLVRTAALAGASDLPWLPVSEDTSGRPLEAGRPPSIFRVLSASRTSPLVLRVVVSRAWVRALASVSDAFPTSFMVA